MCSLPVGGHDADIIILARGLLIDLHHHLHLIILAHSYRGQAKMPQPVRSTHCTWYCTVLRQIQYRISRKFRYSSTRSTRYHRTVPVPRCGCEVRRLFFPRMPPPKDTHRGRRDLSGGSSFPFESRGDLPPPLPHPFIEATIPRHGHHFHFF